jgi:hypothetical protein
MRLSRGTIQSSITDDDAAIVTLRRGNSNRLAVLCRSWLRAVWTCGSHDSPLDGQDHTARLPIEQLRTQLQFKVLDSLANGRLCEPKLIGCCRKASEPSYRLEDPDPLKRWQGLVLLSHNEIDAIPSIFIVCAYAGLHAKCRA